MEVSVNVHRGHGTSGQHQVWHAIAREIACEHEPFLAGRVIGFVHGERGDAFACAAVNCARLSHNDFLDAVARPIQQRVVARVIGVDLCADIAVLIEDPHRSSSPWSVVNVNGELKSGDFRADFANVNGFEVFAGDFPQWHAVAVDEGNAVCTTEGHGEAELVRLGSRPDQSETIAMAAGLIDFGGLGEPSNCAVRIEHRVSSHDFVAAVSVQIDWHRLVSGQETTGITYGPELFSGTVKSPDLGITGLDQDIGCARVADEIGEDDAISCVFWDLDTAFFDAGGAVQFDKKSLGAQDDLVMTVAIPIVNLACDVVVKFLSADARVTPSPEDSAIEALSDHGAGVVDVVIVHVACGHDFDCAVGIEVACHDPCARVIGVECYSSPRLDGGRSIPFFGDGERRISRQAKPLQRTAQ